MQKHISEALEEFVVTAAGQRFSIASEEGPRFPRGHGGNVFLFRLKGSDKVIYSTNVWHTGESNEPDTAEIIEFKNWGDYGVSEFGQLTPNANVYINSRKYTLDERIVVLFEKADKETITKKELNELQSLLQKDHLEVEEFILAKVAFQSGYTLVYRNEDEPETDFDTALPGKWVDDSCVVFDFASDQGIFHVMTDDGIFFYLDKEQQETFKEKLERAETTTVDELLTEWHNSNLAEVQ